MDVAVPGAEQAEAEDSGTRKPALPIEPAAKPRCSQQDGGCPAEGAEDVTEDSGRADCEDVCATLSGCYGSPQPECFDSCMSSHWIAAREVHCLALRIYWINEEGCDSMRSTYEAFSPTDRCED